jgi:hypothetical protein
MKIGHELTKQEVSRQNYLLARIDAYNDLANYYENYGTKEMAEQVREEAQFYQEELDEIMNRRPNINDLIKLAGRKAIGIFKH